MTFPTAAAACPGVPPTEAVEPELAPDVIAAAMEEVAATQEQGEREAAEQAGEEFATPPEVGLPGEEATPPDLAPPSAPRGRPSRVTAAPAATPTASGQPSQVRCGWECRCIDY